MIKKVLIKKTAMYKKGSEIMELLNDVKPGEKLPVKIIINTNPVSGKIEFFAEEISNDNAIGFLSKNQTETGIDELLEDIIEGKVDYTMYLTGIENNLIAGEIEYTPIAKQKVSIDLSVFEKELNRIYSKDIASPDVMEHKFKVMKEHRFPDELILKVLEHHTKKNTNVCNPKTIYIDPNPKDKGASILGRCVLNALNGSAMIYEGDKSVGKNVCAETVAWLLNEAYYVITFNRRMTNDDIYGTKSTDNSAANEITEKLAYDYLKFKSLGEKNVESSVKLNAAKYESLKAKASSVSIIQDPSVFVECVKNGGVLCLNEMNMAEANFFAGFANPLTDGSRFLDIPGVGRLEINPNCIIIGTQNAEYTGVCEQNDATMSRFGCIQFDYPNSIRTQLETVVGKNRLDKKYFIDTDKYYGALLKAVRDGSVSNSCLNIRGFIRALNATAEIPGFTTLAENIIMHVINTCPIDDRQILTAQLIEYINI